MTIHPLLPHKPENRPLIIAGPCSAETEDQVLTTARALAPYGVDLFRAGVWKPRTRPGSFEGMGADGLQWLRRAGEETGLKVATEVANAQHVSAALKAEIDVLWLGARTTANPFSVQEVADALAGVDIAVLIKNPVSPDLKLWQGAIERVSKCGVTRIGAIHRGFSYHGDSRYRNVPRWQIAIDLKRAYPDLPIICDNSHICGRRDMLRAVAQKALDLNFSGYMTEVHPDPDHAWSDADQQITPDQFREMKQRLVFRRLTTDNVEYIDQIEHLRHELDEVDEELLNLLGSRMKLAERIGEYKRRNNIVILQSERWAEILEHAVAKGRMTGLSEEFVTAFFKAVHQESINHQEQVMDQRE